jgi:exodeoxyribonuclease-1
MSGPAGATPTFLWLDYETSGADPRRDRPLQFAAWRTGPDLEPVEDPVTLWCAPPIDRLPSPDAGMVTGIAPQDLVGSGLREADFAAAVHGLLAQPGTCAAGWNSIRFDDEFTRHLLYRNFHDPYAREWEHGNSRWDLIDLARLCYALRPEGIAWPLRDDGAPSFRLEDLARANGLVHRQAHDALGDVEATLALGRLLRARQPRLFDWHFGLRQKRRAMEQLDYVSMTPVLHASQRFPAARGCLSMVVPLAEHPRNRNGVIVYDLAVPPDDLVALDADELHDRVFTAGRDLPEGLARVPLKLVQANRSPALAPLSTLRGVDTARIGLDVAACQRHLEQLRQAHGIAAKVREVFARADAARAPASDPELALYDGFLPDGDKPLLRRVRGTPPEQLGRVAFPFADPRYPELLFRYRAVNWPDTLSPPERARWRNQRQRRLLGHDDAVTLDLGRYEARIAELRATATGPKLALLDRYLDWGRQLTAEFTP